MRAARHLNGTTLVELLVVLVVAGILATAGAAAYGQHLRRAQRLDAMATLLRLQAAQEHHALLEGTYADGAALAMPPPEGLGLAGSLDGRYDLAVTLLDTGAGPGYRATATARADGPQWADTGCRTLFVEHTGLRGAITADGRQDADVTARCWR
jgi:prepilin-type N-terminal cleavage/methylation domain-containing protein